jgi:hypothetical protein
MKKITKQFFKKINACEGHKGWFEENNMYGKPADIVIKLLIRQNYERHANWLIARCFNKKQAVMYAVYSAEQVIKIYEKIYPNDDRPRKAIEAAKKYLKNPCKRTKNACAAACAAAVAAAVAAARAAACAAAVADARAAAVADACAAARAAARAAACAAACVADAHAAVCVSDAAAAARAAARAAACAAVCVAVACADAAAAEEKKLQRKILKYGLKLLKENS